MVATLLSAGARPNLVTDPTPKNPGGFTAADLAYMKGYDGLAAYLSEKSLVEQFNDMSLAGNISGTLETSSTDAVITQELPEDQLYLKDTLAAYRTAAGAAARIQAAYREHELNLRYKNIELNSPEHQARRIVAAMKIQHAFRKFETKKSNAAAARIQHRFRTRKIRREFLHMRRQAIKIQVRASLVFYSSLSLVNMPYNVISESGNGPTLLSNDSLVRDHWIRTGSGSMQVKLLL